MEKGRLLEPRSPSGQNARLRGRIEKETEGVTLVSTRHSPHNSHCTPTVSAARSATLKDLIAKAA